MMENRCFLRLIALIMSFLVIDSSVQQLCHILDTPVHNIHLPTLIENATTHVKGNWDGPLPMAVCVVTYVTEDILDYAKYALAINAIYGELHNYHLRIHHPNDSYGGALDEYDVRWNKVKLLYDAISESDKWTEDCDYALWLDADLIVLNMNFSLMGIVSDHSDGHIIASSEYAGSTTLINSGSLLVKNSAWSRSFLWDWWTKFDRKLFSDQEAFDMIYQDRLRLAMEGSSLASFKKRIAILSPEAMNSDPPAMTQQRSHHPVLHLMGEESPYRISVFRRAFEHLCSVWSEISLKNDSEESDKHESFKRHLHSQLTLSQPILLQTAFLIYQEDAERLLQVLESVNRGEITSAGKTQFEASDATILSLSFCRRVSNVVHHFVHAMQHMSFEDYLSLTSEEHKQQSKPRGPSLTSRDEAVAAVGHQTSLEQMVDVSNASIWRESLTAYGHHLRERVYVGVRANLLRWKKNLSRRDSTGHPTSFAIPADYPEMLKTAAIAGQHLLSAPLRDSSSSTSPRLHSTLGARLVIADEIEQLLDEMLAVSDKKQHVAIQLMALHHLIQEGQLALELGQRHTSVDAIASGTILDEHSLSEIDTVDTHLRKHQQTSLTHQLAAAEQCFRRALALARTVTPTAGAHHLVLPLMMLGNLLASTGAHPTAQRYFREATEVIVAQWGEDHVSLAQVHYNHALSLSEQASSGRDEEVSSSQNHQQARHLFQRVVEIVDLHHPQPDDYERKTEMYVNARERMKK